MVSELEVTSLKPLGGMLPPFVCLICSVLSVCGVSKFERPPVRGEVLIYIVMLFTKNSSFWCNWLLSVTWILIQLKHLLQCPYIHYLWPHKCGMTQESFIIKQTKHGNSIWIQNWLSTVMREICAIPHSMAWKGLHDPWNRAFRCTYMCSNSTKDHTLANS